MLGHGGSSAGSYLADPTSPIPSHCAVIILFQSVTVHQLSWLALQELNEFVSLITLNLGVVSIQNQCESSLTRTIAPQNLQVAPPAHWKHWILLILHNLSSLKMWPMHVCLLTSTVCAFHVVSVATLTLRTCIRMVYTRVWAAAVALWQARKTQECLEITVLDWEHYFLNRHFPYTSSDLKKNCNNIIILPTKFPPIGFW